MVAAQEYKSLIEKMVTSNRRFPGNEDLFEDFCSEALERSLFLLKKTDEIERIEGYLNKLISTAIISVLKSSGRITRNSQGYKAVAPSISIENPLDNGFLDIKDPTISFVEKITTEETLREIYQLVLEFDSEYPSENFYKLFYMKYVEGKKQREIANVLGISQGEVSKRLFSLMQKINAQMQ